MMNVVVTNLTSNAPSTATAPIKSLATPHPTVSLSPLTVVIICVVICLTLLGVSKPYYTFISFKHKQYIILIDSNSNKKKKKT